MSDNAQLILWLIPGAPLLAAAIIALCGKLFLGERSHVPCVGALVVAFACSLALLTTIAPATFQDSLTPAGMEHAKGNPSYVPTLEETISPQKGAVAGGYQWLDIGKFQLRIDLRADAITAIMLARIMMLRF